MPSRRIPETASEASPETPKPRAVVWAPRGLLLTLALFLLLEIALRLQSFGLDGVTRPFRFTATGLLDTDLVTAAADPAISWRLRPNARGTFKGAPFSTNSHGFRERQVALDKPEGVLRTAVLGASMTMGSGVADEEIYSRRLQELLDQGDRGRHEVLNFAVGAYELPQTCAAYEAYVRPFSPDVVMIRLRRAKLARTFSPMPPDLASVRTKPTDVRNRLASFFAYVAIRRLIRDTSRDRLARDWSSRARPEVGPTVQAETLLSRFAQARALEGVRVIVALVPQLRELELREPKATAGQDPETLRWAARHPNVEVVDAYPALLELLDPKQDRIYYGDNHPNARGHLLIAQALAPGILPILKKEAGPRRQLEQRRARHDSEGAPPTRIGPGKPRTR